MSGSRPSLRSLRTIHLNSAARNKEKLLGCIMRVDNLSILVLDQPVEHIEMRAAEYKQTGYVMESMRCVSYSNHETDARNESMPDIRATVSAALMTSPASSS